jgi:hypothetical protein
MHLDFHLQVHLVRILFSLFPFINSFRYQEESVLNVSLLVTLISHMMMLTNFRVYSRVYRSYMTCHIFTVLFLLYNGHCVLAKQTLLSIEIAKMVHRVYTLVEELEYESASLFVSFLSIVSLSKNGVLSLLAVIHNAVMDESHTIFFKVAVEMFFSSLLLIHLYWLYATVKVFVTTLYHRYVSPQYRVKPELRIFQ